MIYLDNAATTQKKPDCVVDAVVHALCSIGNCGRGAGTEALNAARIVYDARERLAGLFGLDNPERVCFTANSTEALNITLFGLFEPGDHIISTDLEHNSVLRPLYALERSGVLLSFLKAGKDGNIDYQEIEPLIRPETKAIVCTHASNLTGNLLDIHQIGKLAQKHGLLFIVDGSQTAGSFPIHMENDHINVLCFTGHKGLMGPQGTGGLCVAPGIDIRPWKVGGTGVHTYLKDQPGDYPTKLEAGTLNGHGIAGLASAVEYIQNLGPENIHKKEIGLMRQFYEAVKAIPGVEIYGDFTGDRAPIVALNIEGYDSGEVADLLSQDFDIAVRAGAHCAPRMHEALGTKERGAVRFSFGWFNTTDEVNAAAEAVRYIAQQ